MNHVKYDGNIHPEEWVRQIRLSFYGFYDINNENTKNEQEIINYCKLLIRPSIKISPETNSFVGLINDLKSDISYDVFKSSVRKKLQDLKLYHISDLTFLINFQQLCYEGEITEIEEQKKLFLNALPKESLQHAFIDHKFDKINSMEKLFKYFYESLIDESKVIKDEAVVTLKHVATGKYLSSSSEAYANYNPSEKVVFAGPTIPDTSCVWIIEMIDREMVRNNCIGKFPTIFYGDLLSLTNKKSMFKLFLSSKESPATRNSRVSCLASNNFSTPSSWHFKSTNSENPPYVKSKDIINIQSDQFVLRSSESTFTAYSKTYQEVACHKDRIGGNDEWRIEIIEKANQ
ncbi:hypothetical protein RclHR1_03500015 [Rhizophagus clarus]|nr:hypothetical protein RclHR1_03500015 [Rhizophagus clarus]